LFCRTAAVERDSTRSDSRQSAWRGVQHYMGLHTRRSETR
jgi:hypothetical protein